MDSDKTIKYYKEVYKEIADQYIIDKLSLPRACAKIGISTRTYYKICKRLNVPSVVTMKDARLDYISGDSNKNISDANNIDEHNCVN